MNTVLLKWLTFFNKQALSSSGSRSQGWQEL